MLSLVSSLVSADIGDDIAALKNERAQIHKGFKDGLMATAYVRERYLNFYSGLKKIEIVLQRTQGECEASLVGEDCLKLSRGVLALVVKKSTSASKLAGDLESHDLNSPELSEFKTLHSDIQRVQARYRELEQKAKKLVLATMTAIERTKIVDRLDQSDGKVAKSMECRHFPKQAGLENSRSHFDLKRGVARKSAYLIFRSNQRLVSQTKRLLWFKANCEDQSGLAQVELGRRQLSAEVDKHLNTRTTLNFIEAQCDQAKTADVLRGCKKGLTSEQFLYALDLDVRGKL